MKTILVVDDDSTFQQMIKASVDPAKYNVLVAGDGLEGLQAMEAAQPDAILLDIKMPKMDGLEFLKKVNEKYGENKIPVLITSNTSSIENISEGVSLGIRGYIVKSNESLQGMVEMIDKMTA